MCKLEEIWQIGALEEKEGNADQKRREKLEEELRKKYSDVFSDTLPPGGAPKREGASKHYIRIKPGSVPVSSAYYRNGELKHEYLGEWLRKEIEAGRLVPSSSEYSSPIILIPKGDGFRVCVNYRALNRITIKDKYPLPRPEDLMARFNRATIYSKLDMTSGYGQIELAKEDRHKSAIITQYGLFEFTIMPFGLTNAPATF
jgi:putative transposase